MSGIEKTIEITTEFVTLGQLLKLADVVASGGEVKQFLSEIEPVVNGEKDNRRGRKIRPGDVVEVPGFGKICCVERA